MAILLLADHDNKTLNETTLKACSAALQIGTDVDIVIIGSGCENVAIKASKISSIRKVILFDDNAYEHILAENITLLLKDLMVNYNILVTSASTNGKNIAPRLSSVIDVPQLSEIIKVIDKDTFERPIYAGNAIQKISCKADKKVITVRTSAFDKAEYSDSACEIEKNITIYEAGLSEFVNAELVISDRPELTSAKIIISGGRGLQSSENFSLIEAVASKLNAAIGASRAAVDAGFVSNDLQVGQTGKIVAPDLYIAVGISGAIQHLAGMKDSRVIVAINKDEDAPIFQVADYGIVGDLFIILPELEKILG